MDVRGSGTRLGTDRPVVQADDRPVLIDHTPTDHTPTARSRQAEPVRPRRRRRAALAGVAVGLLLAAVVGWLVTRGEDQVATRTTAAPGAPAAPAPLSLSVRVPARVVAGQPATVVVGYADGRGVFSGSTEEWGDGVGTSSVEQGQCGPADTTRGASGSYRTRHTWAKPGTYRLTVGVSSYRCRAGVAVPEQASRSVDVVVLPR